jgi:hypothetical protein
MLYYAGAGMMGDFTDHRMFPGDGEGVYFEDNVFEITNGERAFGGGNNNGAAFVVRYNKYFGTGTGIIEYIDDHSNQLGIPGGQLLEIYGNNFLTANSLGQANRHVYTRGQKNIYLYNIFGGTGGMIDIVEEYNDHWSFGGGDWTADPLPINMCPSRTSAAGAKQICPGYTIGHPDSCICWKVHDSYFFNNRYSTNGSVVLVEKGMDYFHENDALENSPPEVDEDVEYFNHSDSFDGAAGVGCGTMAQMNGIVPTTVGVGFWVPGDVTTMPCGSVSADNIKQTFDVNPVTPITGTLYKWNGSSWVSYFTPYTYPHPLRG